MAQHSTIGASTCERWWNCPGSVALCATLPPAPTSIYAEEGTAAHELAQLILSNPNRPATDFVGVESSNGISFTEGMLEGVMVYVDTIIKDMVEMKLDFPDLRLEHRFHLKHIDEAAFGTCDANMGVEFELLRVYDYKNGAGVPVQAKDNKQALYYAVGAAHNGMYQEVELVIVQPNAPHREGPIRRWRIPAAELDVFARELKERIKATREPDAPLTAGKWCKFCPAAGCCPELQKSALAVAKTDFKALPPAPEKMTAEQIKQVLDNADLLNNWLGAVEKHAYSILEHGGSIPGYKLVKKKSNREWKDPEAVEMLYPQVVEVVPATKKLLSPAQLEKLVGKKKVDELCHKPDNGNVIASVDDPREPVAPSALNDFTDVK